MEHRDLTFDEAESLGLDGTLMRMIDEPKNGETWSTADLPDMIGSLREAHAHVLRIASAWHAFGVWAEKGLSSGAGDVLSNVWPDACEPMTESFLTLGALAERIDETIDAARDILATVTR